MRAAQFTLLLSTALAVDFHTQVAPILKANCTSCHNKTTTKGDLNMETPELMLKGGESGPAIVSGKGKESLLYLSAAHEGDSDMPPKGNKVGAVNLTASELALLKTWIDEGAKAGVKTATKIAWQPLPPGVHPIYAVAISPSGDIAACSRANHLFIYDLSTKKLIKEFEAHRDLIQALAFSPDGSRLASGSFGEVKLWKGSSTAITETTKLQRAADIAVLDVAFRTSAVAEADKKVAALTDRLKKATDAKDAAEIASINKLQATAKTTALAAKAALGDAQAVQRKAAADLKAVKPSTPSPAIPAEWTLERTLGTGDSLSPITHRVNALAFSPDGKTLAVGSGEPSRDGDLTFWDIASGKLTRTLADRHTDTVLSLDYSPDGKLIASGGADKQLRISDIATGKLLKTFEGHTHHVMGVSWRADGRMIASSGADNAVKTWDWIKGERRKSLDGWDKEVTSVHYLGASTRLVTTSGDKQVRLIGEDASTPTLLKDTSDFMQCSAASHDGQRIIAGGEDSVLRVWDAKTATVIATFAPL